MIRLKLEVINILRLTQKTLCLKKTRVLLKKNPEMAHKNRELGKCTYLR